MIYNATYGIMMILKITLLIVLLLAVLWLTIFAVILVLGPMVTGFKKAPYVPSFDSQLKIMKKYLILEKWAKIVDLWCGDGKALRFFSKEFGLIGTWYDLNPFVIWYGKMINRLSRYAIKLIRANFKQAQLKRYDYVYLYLWPQQLISMEDRVFEHIGKDAIVISNSFTFVKHIPFDIISDEHNKKIIYLYRKYGSHS